MAVFTQRYPAKQGVSEARFTLARETTMRPGREQGRYPTEQKFSEARFILARETTMRTDLKISREREGAPDHSAKKEKALAFASAFLVTRRGIEPLFSP